MPVPQQSLSAYSSDSRAHQENASPSKPSMSSTSAHANPSAPGVQDKVAAQNVKAAADLSTGGNPLESDEETSRESVYDSYGGYENFMHSFGLKPWDADDVEEGQRIAESMIAQDEEDEEDAHNLDEDASDACQGSIYDSFGGYENFMHSYGLKPWDDDDIDEGALIADVLEAQSRNAAQHDIDSQKK